MAEKLSVRYEVDAEDARAKLEALGNTAEAAHRKIGGSAEGASKGLEGLGEVVGKLKDGLAESGVQIGGLGSLFEGMGGNALKLGGALAIAQAGLDLVGKAAKFLGESVGDTEKFAQAQIRLAAILVATGNAAGLTLGQMNELAEATAKSSLFDPTTATQAIGTLAKFGAIHGEVFQRATRDATDFAAAMGSDLPEAFQALGKALENPEQGMNALRRAGIVLSESEKQLIKDMQMSGDAAGAQAVILNKVEQSVGGVAAALKTGLTGAAHDASVAWHELSIAIGESAVGQAIIAAITNQLQGMAHVAGEVTKLIKGPTPEEQLEALNARIEAREAQAANPSALANAVVGGAPLFPGQKPDDLAAITSATDKDTEALKRQRDALQEVVDERAAARVTQEQLAAIGGEAAQYRAQSDAVDVLASKLDPMAAKKRELALQEQAFARNIAATKAIIDSDGDPEGKLAQRLDSLRGSLAQVEAQYDALKTPAQQVIEGLQGQLDAFGKQARALEIDTELAKANTDATTEQGKQIAALVNAKHDKLDQQARENTLDAEWTRIERENADLRDKQAKQWQTLTEKYQQQIDDNNALIATGGVMTREYQIQIELEKMLAEAKKGGNVVLDDQVAKLRGLATVLVDQHAVIDAQVAAARETERVWDQAGSGIQDAMKRGFTGTLKGSKDALSLIRDFAISVAADIATAFLFKPFTGFLLSQIGAPESVLARYGVSAANTGGGSGSGSGFSLSDIFSAGKGAYSLFSTGGAITSGPAALAAGLPADVAASVAVEQGIGATAAEGAGLAALGATGYGLAAVAAIMIVQQLMKKKPSVGPNGGASIMLNGPAGVFNPTDPFAINETGGDNGFDPSQIAGFVKSTVLPDFDSLLKSTGGTVTGLTAGPDTGFNLSSIQGKFRVGGTAMGSTFQDFDSSDAAEAFLLKKMLQGSDIAGLSPTMASVLKNTQATDISGLQGDIAFGKQYDRGFAPLGQFEQQLQSLNDSFDAAASKAKQLGLAEDKVSDARDDAVLKLNDSFIQHLDQAYGTGKTGLAAVLDNLDKARESDLKEQAALGFNDPEVVNSRYANARGRAIDAVRGNFAAANDQSGAIGQALALQAQQKTNNSDYITAGIDPAAIAALNRRQADDLMNSWSVDQLKGWRDYLQSIGKLTGDTLDWVDGHIATAQQVADAQKQIADAQKQIADAAGAQTVQIAKWAAMEQKATDAKAAYVSALNTEISAQNHMVQAWTSIGQAARSTLNGLLTSDAGGLAPSDQLANAASQVQSLYAQAKGGGSEADREAAAQQLPAAIQTWLALDRTLNASSTQYAADAAAGRSMLTDIAGFADNQVSIAQHAVDLAQNQLDALNSINGAVTTLASAQSNYAATQPGGSGYHNPAAEQRAAFDTLASNYAGQIKGLDQTSAAFQSITSATAQSRDALIASITDVGTLEGIGETYYPGSNDPGANNLRARIYGLGGIPRFAAGGVAEGWAIVGERGPELTHFGSPTRVYSNDNLRSALNDNGGVVGAIQNQTAGVVQMLSNMTAEIQGLRADNQRLAASIAELRVMRAGRPNTYNRP